MPRRKRTSLGKITTSAKRSRLIRKKENSEERQIRLSRMTRQMRSLRGTHLRSRIRIVGKPTTAIQPVTSLLSDPNNLTPNSHLVLNNEKLIVITNKSGLNNSRLQQIAKQLEPHLPKPPVTTTPKATNANFKIVNSYSLIQPVPSKVQKTTPTFNGSLKTTLQNSMVRSTNPQSLQQHMTIPLNSTLPNSVADPSLSCQILNAYSIQQPKNNLINNSANFSIPLTNAQLPPSALHFGAYPINSNVMNSNFQQLNFSGNPHPNNINPNQNLLIGTSQVPYHLAVQPPVSILPDSAVSINNFPKRGASRTPRRLKKGIANKFFYQLEDAVNETNFDKFFEFVLFFKNKINRKPIRRIFEEMSEMDLDKHKEVLEDIVSIILPDRMPPTTKTTSEEFTLIKTFIQKLEESTAGVSREMVQSLKMVCEFKNKLDNKKTTLYELPFLISESCVRALTTLLRTCCVDNSETTIIGDSIDLPNQEVMVQELDPLVFNQSLEEEDRSKKNAIPKPKVSSEIVSLSTDSAEGQESLNSTAIGIDQDFSIGLDEEDQMSEPTSTPILKKVLDGLPIPAPSRRGRRSGPISGFKKNKVFRCPTCPYTTINHRGFAKHCLTHLGSFPVQSLIDSIEAQKDVIPNKEKPISATIDDVALREFIKHPCSKCNFSTNSPEDFMRHFPKHFFKSFIKCLECGFFTNHQETFINHQATSQPKHSETDKIEFFNCDKCEFAISSDSLFIEHYVKTHR